MLLPMSSEVVDGVKVRERKPRIKHRDSGRATSQLMPNMTHILHDY
jgi:hypothetical protein